MDGSTQSNTKSHAQVTTRRKWSVEDRHRIVQASLKSGTTVDAVARLYGVNASQLYDWRKQYRQAKQEGKAAALLPVQVVEPVPVPAPETKPDCSVVIEARSTRVTLSGRIDIALIRTVLDCLAQ
jgi:transposase